MNTAAALSARLTEVFISGKWIANTNYSEELRQVTLEEAVRKTGNLNTIADLCFHINYYLEGLLQVLDGGPLAISDKYSFDAPALHSEDDWQQRVQALLRNAQHFTDRVRLLTDEALQAPFVQEQYGTYYRNIEAVAEHSYYHLGQIVLLRRLHSSDAG